jgi:FtsP/CotA-like multicopper oxidase with cupredoxin domain
VDPRPQPETPVRPKPTPGAALPAGTSAAIVAVLAPILAAVALVTRGGSDDVATSQTVGVDQPYVVDTLDVAPGERYSVLVHLDAPGTWVWHCHILNHVESEDGMFGMVTAVVVG